MVYGGNQFSYLWDKQKEESIHVVIIGQWKHP
jgi:hypothetical protein